MAFAPVFQRPFSATFDRRAAAAAVPWWLAGGVEAANAIAVYQPKGAASLAASYSNLANPGTYDAAPGVAPTWASATGWTFSGTEYLLSSLSPNQRPLTYILRIKTTGTTGYRTLIGGDASGDAYSFDLTATTNVPRLLKQNAVLIGNATSGFASGADTVVAVTYSAAGAYSHHLNGSGNGSGTNNIAPGSSDTMVFGMQRPIAPQQPYNGKIFAIAVYNTTLTAPQVAAVSATMAAL